MEQQSLTRKYLYIFLVVASYWFVSISLVFTNKYLLKSDSLKLDAPLFVTWYQCLVTVIICIVLRCVSMFAPNIVDFPSIEFNIRKSREVLPLSIVFVGMITFNNLSLTYLGVSFYYVGRSLTTVFNVVFTYVIIGQKTSPSALACCAFIVFGFMLGVDQQKASEGSVSYWGVACGILASASVSLNAIYTKRVLPIVDDNIWSLQFYNNINATILFIPLIFLNNEVQILIGFPYIGAFNFWFFMNLAGIFGVLIGYCTALQIQVTSPLTHNISGTAKACAQTLISVVYFSEVKTMLWWISNAVVLLASAAYSRVRQLEMKKAHEEKMPQTTSKV